MSMKTHLEGRLRNTPLPYTHGLLPLFEAVNNSIHAIEELGTDHDGEITVKLIRAPFTSFEFTKRGPAPQEPIIGFEVIDNGAGFHDANLASFETLDSDYKASQGGRGVGRLMWLKAFARIKITSVYTSASKQLRRTFHFNAREGVVGVATSEVGMEVALQTCVRLDDFRKEYQQRAPKSARKIAESLFEHCLWYFVREGSAPRIMVIDGDEAIDLDDICSEYMQGNATHEALDIKGELFELTHVRLKSSANKSPYLSLCAARREVNQENIAGKLPGLHGKLTDGAGDFVYACYVTAPFLDCHVRPERIGFDIPDVGNTLYEATEISLSDIRSAVLAASGRFLADSLATSQAAGRERVEQFVSYRAPRYRPVFNRIAGSVCVDPAISDKDLELVLHKHLADFEGALIAEGHSVMQFATTETPNDYQARLQAYLAKADDLKKSDLANYVFHRKVLIDILDATIKRRGDGTYSTEDVIHSLIMPLQRTTNDVHMDACNLWLLDERTRPIAPILP